MFERVPLSAAENCSNALKDNVDVYFTLNAQASRQLIIIISSSQVEKFVSPL
jgi:hypothetical protein